MFARIWVLASCAFFLSLDFAVADDPAVSEISFENGSLTEFRDEVPVGWAVSVGASRKTDGETARPSRIVSIASGGVALEVDETSQIWRLLSQRFPAKAGACYQIRFEAKVEEIERAPHQFDNCFVGLTAYGSQGQRLERRFRSIHAPDWSPGFLSIVAPKETHEVEVSIFLSKTGRLLVRKVEVRERHSEESFSLLLEALGRYYSFSALKKLNWEALAAEYRESIETTESAAEFAARLAPFLGRLEDAHVWIQLPPFPVMPTYRRPYVQNYDFAAVSQKLGTVAPLGDIGFAGRTPDSIGYVAFRRLTGNARDFDPAITALKNMRDCRGIIIDLRANTGGNEANAQRIASLFTTRESLVYARSLRRSGPGASDLVETGPRRLFPGSDHLDRPLAVLVGPQCMSSGEGFAMMLDALPRATLFGQPTRGTSGNPEAIALPNGVSVYFSRWISLRPNGNPIEGVGIPPDILVAHEGGGDPTFDAAVLHLRKISPPKQ